MKIEVLSRAKKKRFVEALNEFGITKIDEILVRSGKEKIRAFSGELDKSEIMDLWHNLPIEGVGLYVGKDFVSRNGKRETRLTMDGLHVFENQIKGRVLDLTSEQEERWFLGSDVDLEEGQRMEGGFVAVRSGGDFVGAGKVCVSGEKLFSFLPKERRRKERQG